MGRGTKRAGPNPAELLKKPKAGPSSSNQVNPLNDTVKVSSATPVVELGTLPPPRPLAEMSSYYPYLQYKTLGLLKP